MEEWGNRVRKVSTSGIISTVVGGGGANTPATKVTPFNPYGLAIDPAGNLYIGDCLDGQVLKVSPNGAIQTVAGFGNINYFGGWRTGHSGRTRPRRRHTRCSRKSVYRR